MRKYLTLMWFLIAGLGSISAAEPNTISAYPPGAPRYGEAGPKLSAGNAGPIAEGVYEMVKSSGGSLMILGEIEIRGNTCRVDGAGSFKPFTIDAAGGITWPAGLSLLPEGWKIRRSVYTKDSHGKPLIQIYYTSSSGTDDSIDAYLKK